MRAHLSFFKAQLAFWVEFSELGKKYVRASSLFITSSLCYPCITLPVTLNNLPCYVSSAQWTCVRKISYFPRCSTDIFIRGTAIMVFFYFYFLFFYFLCFEPYFFLFWGIFSIFSYNIQHCFICRPSDSTVPTVHWQSDALTTRLDLIRILPYFTHEVWGESCFMCDDSSTTRISLCFESYFTHEV